MGNTLAFLIPNIQQILLRQQKHNNTKIYTIILFPTRELAIQIASQIKELIESRSDNNEEEEPHTAVYQRKRIYSNSKRVCLQY